MAMALSFLMLKRRYNLYQVIAVVIIIAGLAIAIYPSIQGGSNNDIGSIWWNCIFLIGSLPVALSSVYEEKAFAEQVTTCYKLQCSEIERLIQWFHCRAVN